jgi:hypothetical protein
MTEGQIRNNAARTWWDSLTERKKRKILGINQKALASQLTIKFNYLPIDLRYEVIIKYLHKTD